ncbi:MAG: hypothetical protein QXU20_01980 [Candidatus Woesearchaeota archaeon]
MVDTSITPINEVLQLRAQGLTNAQIIDVLQREGYNSELIFDALSQADIKSSLQQSPTLENFNVQNQMAVENPQVFQQQIQQPQPTDDYGMFGYQQYAQPTILDSETEKIEQIAEAIIDEKWNDLVESINKVIDWKNKMEARIVKIEQQLNDLKQQYTELQKGILEKVGEYDQHILDVGTEIKAMEEVFKKIMPAFTQNVNELSSIVKNLKKGQL